MGVVSRLQQGVRALLAFAQPLDDALAAQYLSPSLLAAFRRMQRSEQQHSLRVLRAVLAQGPTHPDLAVAALLHDSGKARYPLAVWQKSVAVMARRVLPHLYAHWSQADPAHFWTRPFAVAEQHPTWSGEVIRAAGGSERAAWIAANHQNYALYAAHHPDAPLVKRLQRADNLH